MHIPDGYLSTSVCSATYAVSTAAAIATFYRAKKKFDDRFVPFVGVSAAFIFAAQMINFPVAGGTSGHFVGAFLASALLGPAVGFWVMAIVLTVQCLVFADGGVTALGANILNMGIVGGIVPYFLFIGSMKILPANKKNHIALAFFASWLSVVLAAIACSLELGMSGLIPLKVVLPAMTIVHLFIGIGEGFITSAVFAYMLNARPNMIYAFLKNQPKKLGMEAM